MQHTFFYLCPAVAQLLAGVVAMAARNLGEIADSFAELSAISTIKTDRKRVKILEFVCGFFSKFNPDFAKISCTPPSPERQA